MKSDRKSVQASDSFVNYMWPGKESKNRPCYSIVPDEEKLVATAQKNEIWTTTLLS